MDICPLLVGGLIGFLASIAAAGLVIAVQRPHLKFEPSNGTPDPRGWKFVHVLVRNQASPWYLRLCDKTAYLCTAELEYRTDPEAGNLFDPVAARWPRFQAQPIAGGVVDPNAVLVPHRETIPPGEHAYLDVAIKHEGDREGYAFSNESYLYMGTLWRHPGRRLDAPESTFERPST